MHEFLTVPEGCEGKPFTDVVVIRPPVAISREDIIKFAYELSELGFLPVVQPTTPSEDPGRVPEKWFPTDSFREVDEYIYTTRTRRDLLNSVLERICMKPKRRMVNDITLPGGNYLHLEATQTVVYTYERESDQRMVDHQMSVFPEMGWDAFGIPTLDIRLKTGLYGRYDLDFLLSVFLGKDNLIHAIAAESFLHRVPEGFIAHMISDEEAERGGCNVADLRRGEILVCANEIDAPSVYPLLVENAAAQVLQTPPHFLDDGGGPRCSMSSFEASRRFIWGSRSSIQKSHPGK